MKKQKREPGRPLTGDAPKLKMHSFKVTEEEDKKLRDVCSKLGVRISHFMHELVFKRVNKLSKE